MSAPRNSETKFKKVGISIDSELLQKLDSYAEKKFFREQISSCKLSVQCTISEMRRGCTEKMSKLLTSSRPQLVSRLFL